VIEIFTNFEHAHAAMAKVLAKKPLGRMPEDNEIHHVEKMKDSLRRGVKNLMADAMDEWMRGDQLKAFGLADYAGKRYAEYQNYAAHLETLDVA
jgi:hypothetical protein